MIRYSLMSRLGLAEPLVRLARTIENSNRAAASRVSAVATAPPLSMRARANVPSDLI